MSPPDSSPDFDPLAAQAAAVAHTLDRTPSVVRVEPQPHHHRPAPSTPDLTEFPDDHPAGDPVFEQVAAREDERLLADPEAGTEPASVVIGNDPPQPIAAELEREPFDPNAGRVERVEQRGHLEPHAPSTDRFAGVSFNPLEGDR